MTMKDLEDRRRRYVGVEVPLKIEADSNGTEATLFSNAQDERHDLGWNAKADIVWSSG